MGYSYAHKGYSSDQYQPVQLSKLIFHKIEKNLPSSITFSIENSETELIFAKNTIDQLNEMLNLIAVSQTHQLVEEATGMT